jgi:hypothetical protein
MKLIIYTLTNKGEIPNYIIDGGYFPKKNDKKPPQDYDMIGLSNSNDGIKELKTKAQLLKYIQFDKDHKVSRPTLVKIDLVEQADAIWEKLNG